MILNYRKPMILSCGFINIAHNSIIFRWDNMQKKERFIHQISAVIQQINFKIHHESNYIEEAFIIIIERIDNNQLN